MKVFDVLVGFGVWGFGGLGVWGLGFGGLGFGGLGVWGFGGLGGLGVWGLGVHCRVLTEFSVLSHVCIFVARRYIAYIRISPYPPTGPGRDSMKGLRLLHCRLRLRGPTDGCSLARALRFGWGGGPKPCRP